MKCTVFFARVGIFLIALFSESAFTHSQSHYQPLNYVVIGAFAVKPNAVKFSALAQRKQFSAKVDINTSRQLYYVYIHTTSDHDEALRHATRLRTETSYTDAWVFYGLLGSNPMAINDEARDINPVTEETIQSITPQEEVSVDNTNLTVAATPPVEYRAEEEKLTIPEGKGKPFLFRLYRGSDGKKLSGEVDIIDVQRSGKVGTYPGNEPVRVAFNNSKSSQLSIIGHVFGYRKMQRDIDYNNPSGEGISNSQGVTVIPFELVRLQKGDIAVMYNVFFFKDAAIMRPESQYEVNALLAMLTENPALKVKIHGHTNGNASGRIRNMGSDQNYFSLEGSTDGFGSAKTLSEQRAKVIQAYLVSNGIEASRMEIKAWGGKRAMFDKHSPRAQENVRVEIEILQD